MQKSETLELRAKIDSMVELGDYITLGKMLGIAQNTARMRFVRNDNEAVNAMNTIVTTRNEMIENYLSNKA